jgi:hypothetical protein
MARIDLAGHTFGTRVATTARSPPVAYYYRSRYYYYTLRTHALLVTSCRGAGRGSRANCAVPGSDPAAVMKL